MIESRYWRAELRTDLRWLRKNRRYARWSEKRMVLFERRLMLVAFQVRTLIDRPKVSAAIVAAKLEGRRFPKIGHKPFTVMDVADLEQHFDMASPEPARLSTRDLCNQLIHHYVLFADSKERGDFTSVVVFSDYRKNECMYEFDIGQLITFFARFCDDSTALGYSTEVSLRWNQKKQDYEFAE
jgi:hypothetical protein